MRFIERCTQAYWGTDNNDYTIDAADRMRCVLSLVAQEIEAMAPSKTIAKICNLQCMEIADKIRRLRDE
jgi:hypothetical protein